MSWCQWSFWNSQPLPSKDQDLPWRLTSELPPPQLGDPAHPQLTASRSQHWPESSLQVEKPHPPPDSRAYRFCFYFSLQGDFHLLDIKVDVNCVICMKLNMTNVNVEWPVLSDLVFVTGWDVMCFPFPWKLKSNFCEEASAICKFCWYHSSGVSLILSLGQKLPIFMDKGLGRLRELMMDREVWHAAVHGVAKSWTRQSDWTELNWRVFLRVNVFQGK